MKFSHILILMIIVIIMVNTVDSINNNGGFVMSNLYLLVLDPVTYVSFGDGILGVNCLPESMYSKNVSAEGQNDTIPLFWVAISSGAGGDNISMWVDTSMPTGFDFKCDDDNTSVGSIPILTTVQKIHDTIQPNEIVGIWCWCDFDNPTEYPSNSIFIEVF